MATLIDTATTVTKAPQRKFHVDSKADHIAEVSLFLSSPITSYDVQKLDSTTVVVKHRQTLEERIKSTKQKLNAQNEVLDELWQSLRDEREANGTRFQKLEDGILDLNTRLRIVEVERQYEKDILLDWETKSRLAQGMNVFLTKSIPQDAYKLLKAESCGYLPYLLSMWAVFHGREPAPRFSQDISREEDEAYLGKAQSLLIKDLGEDVEAVWNSIPLLDRDLMVSMFLSRPAIRKFVVHVKPTINQAKQVLAFDKRLSPNERATAANYLPHLVDKRQKRLFDTWYLTQLAFKIRCSFFTRQRSNQLNKVQYDS